MRLFSNKVWRRPTNVLVYEVVTEAVRMQLEAISFFSDFFVCVLFLYEGKWVLKFCRAPFTRPVKAAFPLSVPSV